jgi:hypothetical protein
MEAITWRLGLGKTEAKRQGRDTNQIEKKRRRGINPWIWNLGQIQPSPHPSRMLRWRSPTSPLMPCSSRHALPPLLARRFVLSEMYTGHNGYHIGRKVDKCGLFSARWTTQILARSWPLDKPGTPTSLRNRCVRVSRHFLVYSLNLYTKTCLNTLTSQS